VGSSGASLADRVLIRTFAFRELVARFFDGRVEAAQNIERVVVGRTSLDPSVTCDPASILFGWMAARLGWSFKSRSEATAGARPVSLLLHEDRRTDLGQGQLTSVEIETRLGGAPLSLSLRRLEEAARSAKWAMKGACDEEHVLPLGFRDEGWVLGRALDAREGDRVTRETLEAAAQWESAP